METKTKLFSLVSIIVVLLVSACSSSPAPVTAPTTSVTGNEIVAPTVEQNTAAPTVTEEPLAATEVKTEGPITFTDGTGREVSLPAVTQRIIVAGKATPYVLDTIFLFPDVAEKLVALELRNFDTQTFLGLVDPKVKVSPMLEKDSGPEQIAPYQPDLVIVKNVSLGKLGSALQEISIPVMGMNLETPEFFYEDIRALGKAFDNSARADEIIAYYQKIEKQLSDRLSGLEENDKPSVLVLQYSEDGGEISFKVPPVSYLQTTMVEKAGGNPIWTDIDAGGDGWIQVGLEQIAAWNPEMVFVVNYKGDSVETAQKLMASPTWAGLKVVENQQIFGYPADFASWDLIDPRWILGQQWMAAVIQPQRTTDIDLRAQVVNFYHEMYGLSDEEINNSILPLLDEIK